MKACFLICLFLYAVCLQAQDKKDLIIGFSAGFVNSPHYEEAKARNFYALSFDYHLAKRDVLSVNYFAGQHRYYEDLRIGALPAIRYADGTNATIDYNVFSVLYKYRLLNNRRFSLAPAAGVGIMTHSSVYPMLRNNSVLTTGASWSDLVFPVSMEFNVHLNRSMMLGVQSGCFIHPDFPLLALHAGIRLAYRL